MYFKGNKMFIKSSFFKDTQRYIQTWNILISYTKRLMSEKGGKQRQIVISSKIESLSELNNANYTRATIIVSKSLNITCIKCLSL